MIVKKQRYPIGLQDFAGLRKDGWVYIDKTEIIYDLVNDNKYVFLARPRRFGKSLLLSTIRYYFEGRKDLFEGLKIMDLEKDWKHHPVLHLSLTGFMASDPDGLRSLLEYQFDSWEQKWNIGKKGYNLSQRFNNIIRTAFQLSGERVVILIDEYDNPLINTLDNSDIHERNRELLKSIYVNLKDMDECIRFSMLTGVSRFSNLTVFSGLNNIKDVTFFDEYSAVCGFTKEEISQYLWPGVERLAVNENTDPEGALSLLKREYDGYHFSENLTDVYNPFSILNCLSAGRLDNYWIQSGVPEFLVKKLKDSKITFTDLFSSNADSCQLAAVDAAFDNPIALFFQTGYLTIKGYDRQSDEFTLGIPNREVDKGLFYFLLKKYVMNTSGTERSLLNKMVTDIEEGNPEEFLRRLQTLLAPISYYMEGHLSELYYERTMYVILHLLGLHVHSEFSISNGRIDLLVETSDFLYVIELKLDKSASEALEQIDSKDYSLPWRYDGRKIFKIGVNFSSAKRNIDSWKIEKDG